MTVFQTTNTTLGSNSYYVNNVFQSQTSGFMVSIEQATRTYEKRPKPKGYLYPTGYTASFKSGNWGACPSAYAYGIINGNQLRVSVGSDAYSGAWGGSSLGSFDPRATSEAIFKARKALGGGTVNLAQAFGERRQTVNLITSAAEGLVKAVKAAKRLDPIALKRALGVKTASLTKRERTILTRGGLLPDKVVKRSDLRPMELSALRKYGKSRKTDADKTRAAAGLWLANSYGVQPLLMDIKGAAEALAKHDLADPERYSMIAKGFVTIKSPVQTTNISVTARNTMLCNLRRFTKDQSRAMVRIDAFMNNPSWVQAASLGTSLASVPSLAYELTPLSFVADWVAPIGDYLDTMDDTLGWTFKSGSTSQKYKREIKQTISAPSYQASWSKQIAYGAGAMSYTTLTRTVQSSFPIPRPFFKRSPFKSTKRLLNAVALMRVLAF